MTSDNREDAMKELDHTDRLSQVAAAEHHPDSLVGSFFHSDADRGWQGCIVGEPAPGIYLVETFEWLAGSSHNQQLVRIDDMLGWRFYDDAEWMTNSYERGVKQQWEEERAERGEVA